MLMSWNELVLVRAGCYKVRPPINLTPTACKYGFSQLCWLYNQETLVKTPEPYCLDPPASKIWRQINLLHKVTSLRYFVTGTENGLIQNTAGSSERSSRVTQEVQGISK